MATKTLKLLADSYDRLHPEDRDKPRDQRRYERLGKGALFEPHDDLERDRLVEAGAALDPAEAERREREEIQRRLEQLDRERDRLAAEQDRLRGDLKQPGKPKG